MSTSGWAVRPVVLLLVFLLVSCSSLPRFGRASIEERRLADGDVPGSFVSGGSVQPPQAEWWKEFGSAELNALMEEAFSSNLDISRAWARLRQARATAMAAGAEGRLQVNGSGDASTKRVRQETNGSSERDSSNSFSLGLGAAYELDLWGRIAASEHAAELALAASEQDVQATALALAGTIATTWVQRQSAVARIQVVEGQIDTSRKYLELLKVRQRKSLSDNVDVLQQEQQVASLESSLPPLRRTLASLELQLRYLLGRPPHAPLPVAAAGLPDLPGPPALGVPAGMLERRPDIQSAWFALQSQEWAVVEAKADRLPALSLTGSASLNSPRFETLFSNWAMNLASGLTAPLMDGGRRRAVVLREQALADERFLAYRDAVLAALHEVADALSSEHWQREYTARLQIEADLAARTLAETQRRYRSGLSDYLPVLTALSSQQRTELGVISAQTELLSDRIKLYQAVGGQVLPATSGADGEKTLPVGGGE